MKGIWTKAFWKDAIERTGSTLGAVFLGLLVTDGFEWSSLGHWAFWAPVLTTTAVTLVKTILAGLSNPATGASLGTTTPTGGN